MEWVFQCVARRMSCSIFWVIFRTQNKIATWFLMEWLRYIRIFFLEVGARESTPKGGDGQLEKISQCRFDLRIISASRDIKRINFVFESGRLMSLLPSRLKCSPPIWRMLQFSSVGKDVDTYYVKHRMSGFHSFYLFSQFSLERQAGQSGSRQSGLRTVGKKMEKQCCNDMCARVVSRLLQRLKLMFFENFQMERLRTK